jgi:hypothetical protein
VSACVDLRTRHSLMGTLMLSVPSGSTIVAAPPWAAAKEAWIARLMRAPRGYI